MKNFFVHWRTSLIGLATAASMMLSNSPNAKYQALGIALLGLFAKDGNK